MYEAEYDDFVSVMTDLCLSVNRPCSDDLVRVFWQDLRNVSLPTIRRRAQVLRDTGKTRFTSHDLRAEPEPAKAPSTYEPPGESADAFGRIAGVALLRFIWCNDVPAELRTQLQEQLQTIVTSARETPEFQSLTYDKLRAEIEPMLIAAFQRTLRMSKAGVEAA